MIDQHADLVTRILAIVDSAEAVIRKAEGRERDYEALVAAAVRVVDVDEQYDLGADAVDELRQALVGLGEIPDPNKKGDAATPPER